MARRVDPLPLLDNLLSKLARILQLRHGLWIIDVCPVNNSSMESVMAGQFCNGKITHCSFQFDYGLNAYWRRSRRGYHASAEGVMGILVYVTWTQLWVITIWICTVLA